MSEEQRIDAEIRKLERRIRALRRLKEDAVKRRGLAIKRERALSLHWARG